MRSAAENSPCSVPWSFNSAFFVAAHEAASVSLVKNARLRFPLSG
jgi:hypothetical protein